MRDVDVIVVLAREGVQNFTFGPAVAEARFADELTAAAVQELEAAVAG